jgi:putative ABC transport system permease protein
MLFVTLLAGIYPALVLTKFRPAEVLKGSLLSGGKHSTLRNGLVVFQFVISICLVAATIVVHNQVDVFKNTNAGFDRENVLVIQNDREIEERTEAFKAELTRHPGILSASFSSGVPGLQVYQARDFNVEGASESENINWYLMTRNTCKPSVYSWQRAVVFEKVLHPIPAAY